MLATFFERVPTVVAMCAAGIVVFVIAVRAARNDIARARGLDKIAALATLCFAVPLAIFGALHLFGPQFVVGLVPKYLPWRAFWSYAAGCGLIAASLSIATGTAVRWSGLLVGMMMFLFVAMIHLPGSVAHPHDRFGWIIVLREMSFGGAGLVLAGCALDRSHGRRKRVLIAVGGAFVTVAVLVYGVEHFLYATALPGVPLRKQMPTWIPGRTLIDYVTGAALLVGGGSVLLGRKTGAALAGLGGWILLMVLVIYLPLLIASFFQPGTGVKLEGVNYFADTLLFAGAILAVARSHGPDVRS